MGIGQGPAPETVELSAQCGRAEGGVDPALELIWRGRKNRSSNVKGDEGTECKEQGSLREKVRPQAVAAQGPRMIQVVLTAWR